jgi:predicted small lipoprotein YifL
MRRTFTLSILMIGLLAVSLAGCGGAGSSITGPTLMETPVATP